MGTARAMEKDIIENKEFKGACTYGQMRLFPVNLGLQKQLDALDLGLILTWRHLWM